MRGERGIDRQGVVKREERGVRSIDRYEREEGKTQRVCCREGMGIERRM